MEIFYLATYFGTEFSPKKAKYTSFKSDEINRMPEGRREIGLPEVVSSESGRMFGYRKRPGRFASYRPREQDYACVPPVSSSLKRW